MSVDTRDKRSSALGVNTPWRGMWPVSDGSLATNADRMHMAFMYRGISSEVIEGNQPAEVFTSRFRGEVYNTEKRGEVFNGAFRGQVFAAEDR